MTIKSQNKRLVKKRLVVPMHYSRTMTADNLSKAANTVGEWVLTGLGKAGQAFNEMLTSGASTDFGLTSPFVMSSVKERRAIQKGKYKALKKANEKIAQGMTWVSPLNYGAAVWNGHGLNAKKGEEEVASWSPAWLTVGRVGEFYLGPKLVKGIKSTPKAVVNTAAKAGVKPARAAVVAREINKGIKQNTKSGRIEVTEDYFNSPDKWYRLSEIPEKFGIEEQGKNVTTTDSPHTNGTADGFRRQIIKKYKTEDGQNFTLVPGKGANEGYFVKLPVKFSLTKNGQAHGNTSQAAKGQIWRGTFAGSGKFPGGILEGLAPTKIFRGMTETGKDSRSNFVLQDWDNVPLGARVGFHTGEMPMSNLGWFLETKNGTYTYEPIIPEKRITYQPMLLLEPPTSLKFFERKPANISGAERAGATKWERNFKPKWHVANYPGYLLKGLMKGSLLERLLSKKGTININLLNAYFNKASQIEKDVTNKVLAEKFDGLKTINYNLFKKSVLDELIGKYNRNYNALSRLPMLTTEKMMAYGGDRLGIIKDFKDIYDEAGGHVTTWKLELPVSFKQFTFESPRIPIGNRKHYSGQPIGHTRTFTNLQEPQILYVMESLSDWAQHAFKARPVLMNQIVYNEQTGLFESPIEYTKYSPLEEHLIKNYLQRQLQENLRYAAENGLTKMRYPTPETAVKIEGYRKVALPRPTRHRESELLDLLDKMWKEYYDANESQLKNVPFLELDLIGRRNIPNYAKLQDELDQLKSIPDKYDYPSEYKTILKKYSDFPKLFLKLYKGLDVKTVTDIKGNTWYEVGVPKGYLNSEWLFKQGGKML